MGTRFKVRANTGCPLTATKKADATRRSPRMNLRTILQQQPVNTTIGITTPGIGIMNMDINGSKPSAKRKANDADNPLLQAAKKSKKDVCFTLLFYVSISY